AASNARQNAKAESSRWMGEFDAERGRSRFICILPMNGRDFLIHPMRTVRRAAVPRADRILFRDDECRLLLGVLLLVQRVARPISAITVIGHALVAAAPIRMLALVERAAGAEPAIAVIGHALGVGLLRRNRLGDGQSRDRQRSREARKREQASDHGDVSFT